MTTVSTGSKGTLSTATLQAKFTERRTEDECGARALRSDALELFQLLFTHAALDPTLFLFRRCLSLASFGICDLTHVSTSTCTSSIVLGRETSKQSLEQFLVCMQFVSSSFVGRLDRVEFGSYAIDLDLLLRQGRLEL